VHVSSPRNWRSPKSAFSCVAKVALGRMIRNGDQNMPILLVTDFPNLLDAPLPGPAMIKPVDLSQLAAAVESSLRVRKSDIGSTGLMSTRPNRAKDD
jgi:hypothetical protein